MVSDIAWEEVRKNVAWAVTNDGANPHGAQQMMHAATHGDVNYMGQMREGFGKVFGGRGLNHKKREEFDACAGENQGRVYNFARTAMGLPEV